MSNVLALPRKPSNSQYPLWSLTVMALIVIVLYALTARWSESTADLGPAR